MSWKATPKVPGDHAAREILPVRDTSTEAHAAPGRGGDDHGTVCPRCRMPAACGQCLSDVADAAREGTPVLDAIVTAGPPRWIPTTPFAGMPLPDGGAAARESISCAGVIYELHAVASGHLEVHEPASGRKLGELVTYAGGAVEPFGYNTVDWQATVSLGVVSDYTDAIDALESYIAGHTHRPGAAAQVCRPTHAVRETIRHGRYHRQHTAFGDTVAAALRAALDSSTYNAHPNYDENLLARMAAELSEHAVTSHGWATYELVAPTPPPTDHEHHRDDPDPSGACSTSESGPGPCDRSHEAGHPQPQQPQNGPRPAPRA